MGEFGVSLKEPRKSNNSGGVGLELDFGVKVQKQKQILEAFPYEETMMMMMMLSPSSYHHPSSVSIPSSSTAFKSSGGMMTASSLGFPFTNAQWKELQRQAMIYKYMMASLPVPPHLLIPIPLDIGSNVRFSNSSSSNDAEPGRCRRTDGKKWRCSRDVAPNHKYCERHMHRGRPRSRKPVEVQLQPNNPIIINNNDINHQIKRPRHDYPPFTTTTTTTSPAVPASISIPTITDFGSSSSPQFLASTVTTTHPQPHFGSPLSPHRLALKSANIDSLASVSSNKEPRGLEWMLKRDPISMSMASGSDPGWHHPLLQNRTGLKLNPGSCSNSNASNYKDPPPPLYMNPYELLSSGIEQQEDNNNKQRGFIDAWSNAAETEESNPTQKSNDVARLSLSSLDLSMGSIGMGLGLMEAPASWMACSTPGGPLGEVLRPTSTNEAGSNSKPSSPVVTMVTSPSGVLQKTIASLSDSSTSSSSSPRVASSTPRAYTKLQSSS